MKQLLIILGLLSGSAPSIAQRLDGEYGFAGIVGESIIFNNATKTFELTHANCDFALKGNGTYRIKGKKLLLQFENNPAPETLPIPKKQTILHRDSSNRSSYRVNIRVMDNGDSTKPIGYASVSFIGTNTGKVTDTTGLAYLHLPGSKKISLQASNAYCEPETIILEGPGNYTITTFLQCDLYKIHFINKGQQYEYKIGEYNEKYVELTSLKANLKDQKIKYWKRVRK
jgi:hypothetical protein